MKMYYESAKNTILIAYIGNKYKSNDATYRRLINYQNLDSAFSSLFTDWVGYSRSDEEASESSPLSSKQMSTLSTSTSSTAASQR